MNQRSGIGRVLLDVKQKLLDDGKELESNLAEDGRRDFLCVPHARSFSMKAIPAAMAAG